MNRIIYVGKHALTTSVSRHIHTNWELIFGTSGSGRLIFDDRTLQYGADTVAIVPPLLPHTNVSEEGFTNIHINMEDAPFSHAEPSVIPADANGFLQSAFSGAFYFYSKASAGRAVLPAYGQLISSMLTLYQPENMRSDIVQRIENNILESYPDASYDLNAFLASLPFSAEYLKKLFKKETGLTPHQYLTDKRLENAASNLAMRYGKANVSEVARQCGFNEPLYFSRLFKRKYNVSPRDFPAYAAASAPADSDSMKIML